MPHFLLSDADAGGDDDGRKRQKRGGKSAAKAASKNKKEPARPQNIEIFTAPRGKKKYVTVVVGLGRNGIDVKLAAKAFGTKFASGSSVSGDDEIVIQGDVRDVLFDFIPDKWPQVCQPTAWSFIPTIDQAWFIGSHRLRRT